MMSTVNYTLTADGGPDDLPRTLRREHEARAREAREREARDLEPASLTSGYPPADASYATADLPPPATVTRFDVPFVHLVLFFLKAVVAAVPALIVLTAILWGLGQLLKAFFPWLLQMQIYIQFAK